MVEENEMFMLKLILLPATVITLSNRFTATAVIIDTSMYTINTLLYHIHSWLYYYLIIKATYY